MASKEPPPPPPPPLLQCDPLISTPSTPHRLPQKATSPAQQSPLPVPKEITRSSSEKPQSPRGSPSRVVGGVRNFSAQRPFPPHDFLHVFSVNTVPSAHNLPTPRPSPTRGPASTRGRGRATCQPAGAGRPAHAPRPQPPPKTSPRFPIPVAPLSPRRAHRHVPVLARDRRRPAFGARPRAAAGKLNERVNAEKHGALRNTSAAAPSRPLPPPARPPGQVEY